MLATHLIAVALLVFAAAAQPPAKPPKSQPSQPPPATRPVPTTVVSNSLGVIIQRGTEEGVEVVEQGRSWAIRDGEMAIENSRLVGRLGTVEPQLLINRFSTLDDTVVVKVNVSPADRPDAYTKSLTDADKARPPTLVDTLGRKYEAVGFVYQDQTITRIRYTKGTPLKGLSDAPSFSRTTPDRHLTLVFSVSLGVQIKEFRIGDTVLETYDPPLKCDQKQK